MPDRSAPPDRSVVDDSRSRLSVGGRILAVWHRVRSGEDPLAFGAVVIVLALATGLIWFWAGSHRGGTAAASAAPRPASGAADRPGGSNDGPRRAGSGGRAVGAPGGGFPGAFGGPVPGGPFASAGQGPEGAPGGPGGVLPGGTGEGLAVHVAGAVVRPGLYHLPTGSRVADAVAVAGGSRARADLDRLNLAARLADGQKVFVFRRGELGSADMVGAAPGDGSGEQSASGPAEPIDLNAAGLAALDSLPGIGPATARAILEERARRGGFRSPRDLLRIPGIGEGRFARLKDHVRV